VPKWRDIALLGLIAVLLLGATVTRPNPVLVTGRGLLFPDGTAAAPAITFASEPTLGWYRQGAAQMGLGGALVATGTGPHAIGGTASEAGSLVLLKGVRTSASDIRTLDIQGDLQAAAGFSAEGINVRPAFRLPEAGAANNWEGIDILLSFAGSGGTVVQIDGILMRTFAAPAGTGIATGIYVAAPPTGATTNLSAWFATNAVVRIDGTLQFGAGVTTLGELTPAASGTRYLCISTTGVIASSASACSGT